MPPETDKRSCDDALPSAFIQVEELDETLNESVRDSVHGRSQAARDARAAKAERAKKRKQQLEEEEEAGALPHVFHESHTRC